jgi:hypothetical protein
MSQKLTPEELQDLQAIRNEANRLGAVLGEFAYQKTLIEFELEAIKVSIRENAKKQQEHMQALGEKYGDSTVDFQSGEITPIEKQDQPA